MGDMSAGVGSWLAFAAKLGVGAVAVVLSLLFMFQDKLLYMPNPPGAPGPTPNDNPQGYRSPKEYKLEFEEHMIPTADGQKIHTWLMLQKDSANVPTLIYFHGNACNMGLRLPRSHQFFIKVGVNVLMMDYRGYGKSSGVPSEKGINLDTQAVLDFAVSHPKLRNSKIVLYGDSLGGAVVFALADKMPNKVAYLIVENTFSSIADMVNIIFPFVSPLKWLVLRIGWDSLKIAPTITQPILFVSGDKDELVPPSHMKALYDAATSSSNRQLYVIKNGCHNGSFEKAGSKAYCERMLKFLFGESNEHAKAPVEAKGGDNVVLPALSTATILPDVY